MTAPRGIGEAVWVELCTEEPESTADFYAGLLGWSVREERIGRSTYRMCSIGGRDVAGISDARDLHAGRARGWIPYFGVQDVEAATRLAADLGGEVASEPRYLPAAGSGSVLSDPFGAVFGLYRGESRTGIEALNMEGALCWNELDTGEPELSVQYYRTLLGYGARSLVSATDRPYTVLTFADVPVAGVLELESEWPNVLPSTWITYFGVASLERSVDRVVELGGTSSLGPVSSPHGRLHLVRDPAGHVLCLIELVNELRPSHLSTNPAVTS